MAAEKEFENDIKEFLKICGAWYVKYWGGGKYTKNGVPDILCCVGGRFIGIEVKASTGSPSEKQIENLRKIHNSGGLAILLFPEDYETFKRIVIKCKNREQVTDEYFTMTQIWHKYEREFNRKKVRKKFIG